MPVATLHETEVHVDDEGFMTEYDEWNEDLAKVLAANIGIDLTDAQRPDRITLSLAGDAAKVTKLDLLLTIDATGSMSDEMRYLQSELLSILGQVGESQGSLGVQPPQSHPQLRGRAVGRRKLLGQRAARCVGSQQLGLLRLGSRARRA